MMKVITLWQPWASLFAIGLKENETRGWSQNYKGPLAIHAAARKIVPFNQVFGGLDFEQRFLITTRLFAAYGDYDSMPTGSILAIGNLSDIKKTEEVRDSISWYERACGDYSDGRFAWPLNNVHRLKTPIPVRGYQRIWNFDETPHLVSIDPYAIGPAKIWTPKGVISGRKLDKPDEDAVKGLEVA